jgi:predicted metal-dependent phosphoesterase TrpH
LKCIAVTDHDTLAGVAEAMEAGKAEGLEVIPGVEITTRWQGRQIDILGYNIQEIDRLHQKLAPWREGRIRRAERILEKLAELGIPITMDDVLRISRDGIIARPHIARAIVVKGYALSVQEVFDCYLGDGKPADVPKSELDLREGIRMIRETGGIAVLAHPVYLKNLIQVEEILSAGLDGIEVWHRKHSRKDAELFLEMARRRRLFVTGGSDFHGDEHRLGRLWKCG